MPRGYPASRSLNLQATTAEAKRVLAETKDWHKTREHLEYWIRGKWGLSRMTVNDYITNVEANLMKDPATRRMLE